MRILITRYFAKWLKKQNINDAVLVKAVEELENGIFEANLGGNIYKKRIRFQGKGKRTSGRTIICFKQNDRAIFVYGFAKNEKSNISPKELHGFKELGKILLNLTDEELNIAIKNGDLIEV